jgi:hypothetical protein
MPNSVKLVLFAGSLLVVFGLGLMLGGIASPGGPDPASTPQPTSGQSMPGMNGSSSGY